MNTLAQSIICASILCFAAAAYGTDEPKAPTTAQDNPRPPVVQAESSCKRPGYPTESRRKGSEGDTIIEFVLAETGFIVEAKVFKSSGDPLLDHLSLLAVVSCRGSVSGSASDRVRAKITYEWRLSR
jgi:TonB family protein